MSTKVIGLRELNRERIDAFVFQLYHLFLDRDPDESGFKDITDRLADGTSLGDIVAAFATSEEYNERSRRKIVDDLRREPHSYDSAFPEHYQPPGEAGRSYLKRLRSGFLDRYCSGSLVLDVGFSGYANPEMKTALPGAVGVDVDYPGYDGIHLPFDDGTVDCVFSSHCLEHIEFDHAAIRDWYRVLRIGGHIACMVPSQALYEKRRFLPSQFNSDHKRMYSPSSLARVFEEALEVNSFRVRHLAENDEGFNYELGPDVHSDGAYEIEIVIEKICQPDWSLA